MNKVFYDLYTEEKQKVAETDARQTAKEIRDILAAIQVTLANIDDMIVGDKLK